MADKNIPTTPVGETPDNQKKWPDNSSSPKVATRMGLTSLALAGLLAASTPTFWQDKKTIIDTNDSDRITPVNLTILPPNLEWYKTVTLVSDKEFKQLWLSEATIWLFNWLSDKQKVFVSLYYRSSDNPNEISDWITKLIDALNCENESNPYIDGTSNKVPNWAIALPLKQAKRANKSFTNITPEMINEAKIIDEKVKSKLELAVAWIKAETKQTKWEIAVLQAETKQTKWEIAVLQAETKQTKWEIAVLQAETKQNKQEILISNEFQETMDKIWNASSMIISTSKKL